METPEDSAVIDEITKNGMKSFMELIKASNNLPIEQWDFFSTFPTFNGLIAPKSQQILEILNSILQHQQVHGNIIRRDTDEKYEMIIEANDAILERVDCNLDELQGLKKNPEPVVGEIRAANRRGVFSSVNISRNTNQTSIVRSLVTSRLNTRPQIKFKDKIDNRNIPFEPRIKEKPNALKPLAILLERYDDRGESFSHPYEYELDMFKPLEDQLIVCNPQEPKALSEVPLIYINDLESLNKMMENLKKCKEIAVDVEHHSYRSFLGFTCLVQISTRDTDYIIDALELRHELHILNEVFTDPKIVKVLHGAEHDIEWLQRDLCVYIVNLFDTHQASQVLNFPRLNLAYLLKVFCNIDSNKQFQLYDWRTRPLPDEAIKYAREDTHYLLFVYDKLKNALIEKCQNKSNLLESVIDRSNEICKRKYWKDILTEDSHMEFYRKSKKMFDNRQLYALKEMYQWRDKIAREEDESIMYVLPNHMLLNIAENLPREVQGISALCNPVPPLVKQHEREIHKIILKAREQSLVKPVVEGDTSIQTLEMQPNWVPVNVDSKLYCPHDLSRCDDDIREDLPTLLQRNLKPPTLTALRNNKFSTNVSAAISILGEDCKNCSSDLNTLLKGKERQWKFVSPYQRYQKVMAFVYAEESKENEEKSEICNESADTDGPSPAKIPKPDESQEPMATVEQVNSNNEGVVELTATSEVSDCGKTSQPVPTTSLSSKPTPTSVDVSNSNKKKKKKKKKINQNLDASSSYNEVNSMNSQSSDGNENESMMTEPNIKENSEIIENSSLPVNKQSNKISETVNTRNSKKKKPDDNGDKEVDKKKSKTKDDFQPYNYGDVDFNRFQSCTPKQNSKKTLELNKKPQGRRTPWLGNTKNLKKTIGSLKK